METMAQKREKIMAANATTEVEGQEAAALAAKEHIHAVAAPATVVDAQSAIDKEEEDVMAATTAAEEHKVTAADWQWVVPPSRWWFEAQLWVRAWATAGETTALHAGNTSISPIITADW